MRVLLTGKTGQLGWELHRQLERDFEVIALGREDVDFLDIRHVSSALRCLPRFDLIVNAAAFTDVEKAESEKFIAEAINSESVAILAVEADRRNVPMIHFSTNHVFGGKRQIRMLRETDQPCPISQYGITKLYGEVRLRNILEKHLIFRLSGLYGIRCRNFFTMLLHRYRKNRVPRVSKDQIISPNWTPLVAEAVVEVINQMFLGNNIPWGTYHLSGEGSCTPYEFARLITAKVNQLWGFAMSYPIPIDSNVFRVAAKRPKSALLDPTRFHTTFKYMLPDWQEQFLHFFGGLQPQSCFTKEKKLCSVY